MLNVLRTCARLQTKKNMRKSFIFLSFRFSHNLQVFTLNAHVLTILNTFKLPHECLIFPGNSTTFQKKKDDLGKGWRLPAF